MTDPEFRSLLAGGTDASFGPVLLVDLLRQLPDHMRFAYADDPGLAGVMLVSDLLIYGPRVGVDLQLHVIVRRVDYRGVQQLRVSRVTGRPRDVLAEVPSHSTPKSTSPPAKRCRRPR